jgi:MFS family permease
VAAAGKGGDQTASAALNNPSAGGRNDMPIEAPNDPSIDPLTDPPTDRLSDRTTGPIAKERLGGQFAKLWAASTTSAIGSGLATVATPLLVASRTNSPFLVSIAATVSWLPWLIFALPGGVLVDRLDRRRVMVTIDWVRVAALVVLGAALVANHASIGLLYGVLFITAVGEVTFRSASQAFIPALVPPSRLERANGWLAGGSMLTAGLFAGPLGGFLYAVTPSLPFLANAGTYAASAILVGLIGGSFRARRSAVADVRADVPADSISHESLLVADVTVGGIVAGETVHRESGGSPALAPRPSVWSDMLSGLRWLVKQRLLRTMAVLIGLLNVTLTAAMSVLVLLAKERLHLGSVGYGALFSCLAVGGLLGSAFGDRLIGWVSAAWTIRIGLLVEAVTHLVLATSHNAYTVGLIFFAFGIHGALWTIASVSLRQRLTPPEMLGRVGSASLFVGAGGNCVGALLGGALATAFGLSAPYWVGFVVAIIVAAATWRVFDRASVEAAYASSSTVQRDQIG